MKYIYLLGACGSIGTQTLDVIRKYSNDLKVIGLSVGHDSKLAKKIISEFKPEIVSFRTKEQMEELKSSDFISCYGDEGLLNVSKYHKYDNELLVNALVGSAGLKPTVEAINAGKNIALANKETLVMAGDQVKALLREKKLELYPIDSEHSAIWQCLQGEDKREVKSLIITASGGSFRDKTRDDIKNATKEDALKHPNWSMGAKITIDSASMMNKGFEVIEAHHLFDMPYEKIRTVMHRESIIHSLVEYNDLGIKAHLASPDMRGPILYALMYPQHLDYQGDALDLVKVSCLHFEELSEKRFPCLSYAYEAGKKGGLYPTVLNAANEAAVKLFLHDKIKFLDIEKIIRKYLDEEYSNSNPSIDEILALNEEIQRKILNEFGVDFK